MPSPVLALHGIASSASMPITSSISALGALGVGLRQVHLVEHRDHLDAEVERGVAVGHRLRLDALAGIDDQQRAFAGRQRAADFVREVDVARACRSGSGCRCWPSRAVYSSAAVCALIVMPRSRSMSIESSTCASISRSLKPPQRWIRRSASVDLAVVDVGNDREIADVVHALRDASSVSLDREDTTAQPLQRRLISRSDVKAPKRRVEAKKKARRMNDAPSNKTYGNCLLGLHCSQKHPGRKPRHCLISRRCRPPTRNSIHSLSTNACGSAWG